MDKILSKAITLRTKLRNKFLSMQIDFLTRNEKTVVYLYLKKRKRLLLILTRKILPTTKHFGKLLSLLEKTKSREKPTLIENEKMFPDDTEVTNCLNNFFSNIVKNLEIPKYEVGEELY